MPGATLLTLTSSSTLDRSRYLRSQISSGYNTIRLEFHQGHSARSHAAHLDEFVYSGQVTLPEETDQLRLHCHSATSPLGLSARSHAAHLDEFVYSGQVTLPEESDQLRLHCRSGYIANRLHRHSASAPGATLLILTSTSILNVSNSS